MIGEVVRQFGNGVGFVAINARTGLQQRDRMLAGINVAYDEFGVVGGRLGAYTDEVMFAAPRE